MKILLTLLTCLFILSPNVVLSETIDDLVKRDGLYYKKYSDVPFNGEVTGRSQGIFENGKRVGPWVTYHDNGQLQFKGTYKDGKKHGPWVQYFDMTQDGKGILFSKGTYKDGKREGFWIYNNDFGKLRKDIAGTYKNDKKISD